MTNGVEALYDYRDLHPGDLLGILVKETKLVGIINNFPLRRQAVPYDAIEIFKNNDRDLRVFIKDACLNIVNVAGAVGILSIRHDDTGPIVIQKRTDIPGQGMIGSPDQGEIFFYLVAADTVNLDARQYIYDVTVIMPGNKPYTTCNGVINLLQPVR